MQNLYFQNITIATATTAGATVAGQAVTVGVTGYVTTLLNSHLV